MSKPSGSFTIGEVAEKTGLRPSALRYYESMGILPVQKREGGKRLYDASIFQNVRLIQAAQRAGFSIEEIRTLLDGSDTGASYAERLQALARRKLPEVEKLLADVEAMRQVLEASLTCQCARIEDCLLFMKEENAVGQWRSDNKRNDHGSV